jgi:L-iditol 2-dehydrogenase
MTMKAAVLFGKEDLRIVDLPVPEYGAHEVLLKVRAAAICGTDIRMYRNGFKGVDVEHPLVIGHEIAGTIAAVGSSVTAYAPGLRVAVAPNMGCGICPDCIRGNSHMCRDYQALGINLDGGFAEFVRIPEKAVRSGNIMPLEDHVSFAEAAVTEALSCVYNGIEQCRIIGAGPIGIMHAMMAKMCGAGKVFVNDIAPERLDIVRSVDPFFRTIGQDLRETIMKETDGYGADVIITACPVPSAQQEAIELAANYGRICLFGGLADDRKIVPFNANLIHYKQLIVTGTTRASLRQFRGALGFVSAGTINISRLITSQVPLAQIEQGFQAAMSAKGLKNVVTML